MQCSKSDVKRHRHAGDAGWKIHIRRKLLGRSEKEAASAKGDQHVTAQLCLCECSALGDLLPCLWQMALFQDKIPPLVRVCFFKCYPEKTAAWTWAWSSPEEQVGIWKSVLEWYWGLGLMDPILSWLHVDRWGSGALLSFWDFHDQIPQLGGFGKGISVPP